ncbi:dephospho-CoA kinase [Blastopirellula marina]|uniref:Dephospho-CoA kinase n=1 Tax=Blastopirellula marina DSM 3645 TaxID=314230 RepID=A3ZQQ1_9BACT|nr:dephospho-CoA kinase [Blastopirellula marina]EAQ80989.1 Dephospho-CoA kinase [Blastopirellula marina DSM 3645]
MKVIGILGGIASGKSTVASLFRNRGAVIADADQMGHEVLRDEATKREIREKFGSEVFQIDGEVDRRQLAAKVFGGDDLSRKQLAELEKITHPRIKTRLQALIQTTMDSPGGPPPALIMDAALLVRAGWSSICDNLLFIDSPLMDRLQRSRQRGWSDSEFNAREAAQEKLEEKRVLSDYIIRNGGDLAQLDEQVEHYWRERVLTPTS